MAAAPIVYPASAVALTPALAVPSLLERRRTRGSGTYSAWDEKAGGRARRAWRDREGDPLTDVRAYRNRLVHGRVMPQLGVQVVEVGPAPPSASG